MTSPELREAAWLHIVPFEGSVPWMYLDTKGIVTVGVGCVLGGPGEATNLPFVGRGSSKLQFKSRVESDYVRVRASKDGIGKSAAWFASVTSSRLQEGDIRSLFDKRVDAFVRIIARSLPSFVSFPLPAQVALLDMAFNLGGYALVSKWPRLMDACTRQDWQAAQHDCVRTGVQPERNMTTVGLFEQARLEQPLDHTAA